MIRMQFANPLYFVTLFTFLFVLAVATALFEIQIEGKYGWAAKLPTWRHTSAVGRWLFNRSQITGYHLYLSIMLLLLFHFPIILLGFSWMVEWTILSLYFAYSCLWDVLWFILNPAFGWKRFRAQDIWWFQKWIGPFPSDYYATISLSGFCAYLRGSASQAEPSAIFGALSISVQHLLGWAIGLSVAVCLIVILSLLNRRLLPRGVSLCDITK